EGRAARVARLRVQLLRRRAAAPEAAVPETAHARALPRRSRAQARAHASGGDAAEAERLAPPTPALLRRTSAGTRACRLLRQRHSAAVGEHDAGVGSMSELGGIPPDRRYAHRGGFTDFGAARRRAVAALLLPLVAHARHGGQPARALGRDRSGACARGER